MSNIKTIIESAFEDRAAITPKNVSSEIKQAIHEVIANLDSGKSRIAEKIDGEWKVHQWLKKAVLLYFRTYDNEIIDGNYTQFFDKVPVKFQNQSRDELEASGVRIVPPAMARRGSYIAPNTIL